VEKLALTIGGEKMVIQTNMSPKSIVSVWGETATVFKEFNVSLSDSPLEDLLQGEALTNLLTELNKVVGSSSATCVEGG
jgi:hypothetical protein